MGEIFVRHCQQSVVVHPMSTVISALFFFSFLTLAAGEITFHYPNLFPESAVWDPVTASFILGSTRFPTIHSLSDGASISLLVSDPHLPPNVSILGLALDSPRRRLLAVVVAPRRFPVFDALAAYDLRSGRRLFLSKLSSDHSDRAIANGVAVDSIGNAYVTASLTNSIWKVDVDGAAAVFSTSPVFHQPNTTQSEGRHYSWCGLNGIVYAGGGYLLAVQTNSGRVFKVDTVDGTAALVRLENVLAGPEAVAVRGDKKAVVIAQDAAWLLKSDDEWGSAVVEAKVGLDAGRFPTGVVVRDGVRAYVLYGRVNEGMAGGVDRDEFSLEEIFAAAPPWNGRVTAVLVLVGVCCTVLWLLQMARQKRD